jgi:hypothetical protein
MAGDAPTKIPNLQTLLEAVPDRFAETAMLVIAALATAYNQFNARRDGRREGRRKSDLDTAALVREQAALTKQLEELTGEVHTLTASVRHLEDRLVDRR